MPSTLLESLDIKAQGLKAEVDEISLVIGDTAHDVTTAVHTLLGISENVTNIRNMLPEVAHDVQAILHLTVIFLTVFC